MAPPPRLHVIPATACDKALILRRGPNDCVASLLWDRATQELKLGQWLRGRIYEHRADLSPDGQHMVYFAGTGRNWWTAVSRAPWLRAIAFYPQDHTWHGGGAFDAMGNLWLNGATVSEGALPDALGVADVSAFSHATDGFHMGDLFKARMEMRGWQHHAGTRYDLVMRKPLSAGWSLELSIVLHAKNRGLISNRYALAREDDIISKPSLEWAEPFGNLLQFAENGALWEGRLSEMGVIRDKRMLHDFCDMEFEAIEAPYQGVSTKWGAP